MLLQLFAPLRPSQTCLAVRAHSVMLHSPQRAGFDVVADAYAPSSQSLPDALQALFPTRYATTTAAKKAVRRKLVLIGDETKHEVSDMVQQGVHLQILARVAPGPGAGEGRRGKTLHEPLQCVFEDDHLAVVYKPPGLSVQSDVRARITTSLTPTLATSDEPLWRPQHVHRLDRPTSGLVLVAKTGRALRALSASFAARQVHKQYRAVVAGALDHGASSGAITRPLSGKAACTEWRVLEQHQSAAYGHVSLLELHPVTGRNHQLRRHLAMKGCPIFGDHKYWPSERPWPSALPDTRTRGVESEDQDASADEEQLTAAERSSQSASPSQQQVLMLSAVRLELPHPATGETLRVQTPQPDIFDELMRELTSS